LEEIPSFLLTCLIKYGRILYVNINCLKYVNPYALRTNVTEILQAKNRK